MDEDLGFDSGFDDMGSSDIDIDSGFDDASLDTDFSVDDIGTDDIVSDEFSEMDSSMDAGEAFDSFDDKALILELLNGMYAELPEKQPKKAK